uniref:CAZy families GT9 protein n=1 Tax=uncultured Prevotella sp. TaxID=159272 RepID=A0A060CS54_9BACT|nr:CAZy families GT9 protein [uncultured Prevotella sp.]
MVSMDSANMHLASLTGTRVLSIWGNTHPYMGFLGYGQSMDDVIQDESFYRSPKFRFWKRKKLETENQLFSEYFRGNDF